MNIIVLTDAYYPDMSPVSNCIEKYIKELVKRGCFIDVICPKTTKNDTVHFDNIDIHRITNVRNNIRIICNDQLRNGYHGLLWSIISILIRLYGVMICPFVYPTREAWMKKKYLKEIRTILGKKKIDTIISASGYPCTHMAVVPVKHIFPKIKWITYTLDPFTFNDGFYDGVLFKKIRKRKNYEVEKNIYDLADYNIFTEELFNLALEKFQQTRNKTICFPYVLTDFSKEVVSNRHFSSNVRLVYAGALLKEIRNPEILLAAVVKLNNISLNLFVSGNCKDLFEKYKSQNIQIKGLMHRKDYLDTIYNKADILINFGNANSLQSPSKFLELLSTGLPLINFYYKKDSCFILTEQYPLGINICQTDGNVDAIIKSFVESSFGKRISFEEIKKMYPENTIEAQINSLLKILN